MISNKAAQRSTDAADSVSTHATDIPWPGGVEKAFEVEAAAGATTPVLEKPEMSGDLVLLNGCAGPETAPYLDIAQKILAMRLRRNSLFFTSSQSLEGAPETAINLAALLGRLAGPALLVDLQLTTPGLWQMLGKPAMRCGLEDALCNRRSLDTCLYQIQDEQLYTLLIRQPLTMQQAGQAAGPLNDFLEWAEERFTWIVMNCPPVLAPAWTRWFQLNADPAILVARQGKTRKVDFRRAVNQLGDGLAATIFKKNFFET